MDDETRAAFAETKSAIAETKSAIAETKSAIAVTNATLATMESQNSVAFDRIDRYFELSQLQHIETREHMDRRFCQKVCLTSSRFSPTREMSRIKAS